MSACSVLQPAGSTSIAPSASYFVKNTNETCETKDKSDENSGGIFIAEKETVIPGFRLKEK